MVYFDQVMHNYAGNGQFAFWHQILINRRAHYHWVGAINTHDPFC